MASSLIELKNINLTYNKGKENSFQSLFNVNLSVKKGEFLVIFGPSGCGKSSLLNVMAGLEDPDEGVANVDGRNLIAMEEREKVNFHCTKMGMIFQSYNLISTLNVLNNVALPQMFNNKPKKEREERAMQVLERFGIEKQWSKIPTELSGGQQQRIGIARAIVNDPDIILADEPIGNLDTKSANNVMEILGNLNKKEGKTVVLVSHNPENIIWGTHIVHMKDGKIIKEEFKEAEDTVEVVSKEHENTSEFDRMVDRLKGLSKEQIAIMINPLKAKMLVESFLVPYEKNQTDVMEKGVEMYLLKSIEADELLDNLDKDTEKGGAGLDFRTAKNFFHEVENITKAAAKFVKTEDINEKTLVMLDYLTEKIGFHPEGDDRVKLGKLLRARIENKLSYESFKGLLDISEGDGAALDKRVAKKVLKEFNLFLMVSYGLQEKREINKEIKRETTNKSPFIQKEQTKQI